ncbi:ANTAR domain-containing protein [Actinomycetospora cinnamomea]|uniref:ANTAR domain-containing protein n=1 Tax=Actinomycetospora cinnamomea TaxID=663609 RepID=A0A2U1F480_9PSEU|nr:ANTAR domain-containing protein [Actinomycetospora cinnamomea]PVZ06976.1 ANTAR domain-containing protein [Actinomycetospora cinnamomea]
MPADAADPPTRHLLDVAAGVLMARHDLGAQDAYALLMDTAWATDRTIAGVVDQVIRESQRRRDVEPGRDDDDP